MRKFRQPFAAAVLTLLLTFSTFAGDIQIPGIQTEPPAVTGQMDTPSTTGDMTAPGAVSLDPLTEAALSLLQSVLSIF